jgi:hypothetical protein
MEKIVENIIQKLEICIKEIMKIIIEKEKLLITIIKKMKSVNVISKKIYVKVKVLYIRMTEK